MRQHFWSGDPQFGPLDDAWVEAAQNELGVQLPEAYVALLRVQNGGSVRYDSHAATGTGYSVDHIPFDQMFGIGPDTSEGLRENAYYLEEWEMPEGLVLLSGSGHNWVALDYRSCGSTGEPPVVWRDNEAGEGGAETPLAPSFEAFVNGLVREDHNHYLGIEAQNLEAASAALSKAFGVEFTKYDWGISAQHPSLEDESDDPAELELTSNRDEEGEWAFPEHSKWQILLRARILQSDQERLASELDSAGLTWSWVHKPVWKGE